MVELPKYYVGAALPQLYKSLDEVRIIFLCMNTIIYYSILFSISMIHFKIFIVTKITG